MKIKSVAVLGAGAVGSYVKSRTSEKERMCDQWQDLPSGGVDSGRGT